jgi:pimeloyl-ACP methyl ester carboxylesterase
MLPDGIRSKTFSTPRLRTHALLRGPDHGIPVILVHGNVSSGRFYAELMTRLPDDWLVIAPDFRSYGDSETAPIDATRGVRDLSDDLFALVDHLGLDGVHLFGWSVGGGVVMQAAIDHPARVRSVTLQASMSPHGFGGTKGLDGTPCFPDHAGTGGGTANPQFKEALRAGDRTADSDVSPRTLLRSFYVKPPFAFPPEIEDDYVDAMLKTTVGDGAYGGDMEPSENWPLVRPGRSGTNNAISSRWCDLTAYAELDPPPPTLWIRGADDQIVSDASLFDLGTLGQLGVVPGWPGADVFPPQPMVGQLHAMLERCEANGGTVDELLLSDCGHSPHLEHPEAVVERLVAHIRRHARR